VENISGFPQIVAFTLLNHHINIVAMNSPNNL